jgi:hypothetical protein
VRAADLDDLGAELLQPLDRTAVGALDARLVALAAQLADHADAQPGRSPDAPARAASTTDGTGASIEVESSGSYPPITSCSSAASSTVRAQGPPWSSDDAQATRP